MKTIIGLPYITFLYWYSDKKEAVIDFKKNEITTHTDDNGYTQIFHPVSKYELFTLLKFIIPSFLVFMLMDFGIFLKNEIGLLVAILIVMIWHRLRHNNSQLLKIGEIEISVFAALLFSIAALIVIFTIVGIFTSTLSYISKAVSWIFISMALYEIVFEFLSQSWKQYRKVYVKGLPHYIPRYFKLPEDNKSINNKRVAKQIIDNKIYIVLSIIAAIGLTGLAYDGATAYKAYKTQQIEMAKYNKFQQTEQLKIQAEQNGSVQTVITYEKIKLAPNVEELHKQLNIPDSYKEIKVVTYPWEKGYRGACTMISNPPEETRKK